MAPNPSINPTTAGGGPQEAVSTPMRTGELRSTASTLPESRQTSSAKSITANPKRPLPRCFSPAVQQHCLALGSLCIDAPKDLSPPFCSLDIGVVILLQDKAISEQRHRCIADQLHVALRAGVPRGELLDREGHKGPAQPGEQVEGL